MFHLKSGREEQIHRYAGSPFHSKVASGKHENLKESVLANGI